MKLHILSDLHLEGCAYDSPVTDADVVVLAGDIGKHRLPISWARKTFPNQEIIYVPGNHEFYGFERADALLVMRDQAKIDGVHLLDNDEVVIDGVRFLGSTMWTDFKLFGEVMKNAAMFDGQRCLNDFRLIHENGTFFTPQNSIELHEKSLAWLTERLDDQMYDTNVVVTHHLPSKMSVVERYKNQLLSACFASELDHLFGKMQMWIHGHTHDSIDYEVNETRVICNPRGYQRYSSGVENFYFNPNFVVEVVPNPV